MSTHLILFASRDGQTQKIADAISQHMSESGLHVELKNIETSEPQLSRYTSVLIGAPIRYGHHLKSIQRFIASNHGQLSALPNGFFSVNLTARKPEKQSRENNRYMQKFLKKSAWQPGYCGALAGALLYSRYPWYDRLMIQLIMKITGGSTDTSVDIEYTDWDKVNAFAQGYVAHLSKTIKL